MAQFIPDIGCTGAYVLRAPFDTIIKANTSYVCRAVKTFNDIIGEGEDPFELYYDSVGLTQSNYDSDAAASAVIVSLQAGTGEWVYVPSTYIVSFPLVNGTKYHAMMLGVSIGAVPDTMDLTAVKNKISDDVLNIIGIRPTMKEVAVSAISILSAEDAQRVEAARAARITIVKSNATNYQEASARADRMQLRLVEMETYIKSNRFRIEGYDAKASRVTQLEAFIVANGLTVPPVP